MPNLLQSIKAVLALGPLLEGINRRLDRMERSMNDQLTRLLKEVSDTKGQNASVLAFVRGVPDLVRKAVEEALAANPNLTAEDLAAISQAADDLDAGQAEISAAIAANPPAPAPEPPTEG